MTDQNSIQDEFSKPSGNGHGNGSVHHYRLNEVERRLGVLEHDVKEMKDTLTRIESNLQNVATKEYVWKWLAGTVGFGFVTIALHILFRWMSLPSGSG